MSYFLLHVLHLSYEVHEQAKIANRLTTMPGEQSPAPSPAIASDAA